MTFREFFIKVLRAVEDRLLLPQEKSIYPEGHYHSPIPDKEQYLKDQERLYPMDKNKLLAIDFNEAEQKALLDNFKSFYNDLPFAEETKEGLRYYYNNTWFCYCDAIILYSMLRHFAPKRIIEIGSGFSSAVILDTIDLFIPRGCKCNFIEPFPERLNSILKEEDKSKHKILVKKAQDVGLALFDSLEANDILFIDSSHVTKVGSDVNHIFFEVLPRLKPGVIVHFHDIFYPFEYPKEWILEGRFWNESYLLRAFLQYNTSFKIIMFNPFMEHYHEDWFKANMPLCLKNRGASIWFRRS